MLETTAHRSDTPRAALGVPAVCSVSDQSGTDKNAPSSRTLSVAISASEELSGCKAESERQIAQLTDELLTTILTLKAATETRRGGMHPHPAVRPAASAPLTPLGAAE